MQYLKSIYNTGFKQLIYISFEFLEIARIVLTLPLRL